MAFICLEKENNMKKRILILLLVMLQCLGVSHVLAQEVCDIGFYAGTNMAKLNERFFDYDNRIGGQAGVDLKVGNKWCQGEFSLGYLNVGAKYSRATFVGSDEAGLWQEQRSKVKSSGHYIDIPMSLALGWWDMKESGFCLTVSGGAYMSIGLGGRIKETQDVRIVNEYGVLTDSFTEEASGGFFGDEPYQQKRFDAGWTVGARLALGSVFRIAVSYRHGLVNLSNIDGYKVNNNAIMFSLIFAGSGVD